MIPTVTYFSSRYCFFLLSVVVVDSSYFLFPIIIIIIINHLMIDLSCFSLSLSFSLWKWNRIIRNYSVIKSYAYGTITVSSCCYSSFDPDRPSFFRRHLRLSIRVCCRCRRFCCCYVKAIFNLSCSLLE